ncbi:MAG: hypothetical protein ACR2P3_14015 [Geminicoccaceae bacterium]
MIDYEEGLSRSRSLTYAVAWFFRPWTIDVERLAVHMQRMFPGGKIESWPYALDFKRHIFACVWETDEVAMPLGQEIWTILPSKA